MKNAKRTRSRRQGVTLVKSLLRPSVKRRRLRGIETPARRWNETNRRGSPVLASPASTPATADLAAPTLAPLAKPPTFTDGQKKARRLFEKAQVLYRVANNLEAPSPPRSKASTLGISQTIVARAARKMASGIPAFYEDPGLARVVVRMVCEDPVSFLLHSELAAAYAVRLRTAPSEMGRELRRLGVATDKRESARIRPAAFAQIRDLVAATAKSLLAEWPPKLFSRRKAFELIKADPLPLARDFLGVEERMRRQRTKSVRSPRTSVAAAT